MGTSIIASTSDVGELSKKAIVRFPLIAESVLLDVMPLRMLSGADSSFGGAPDNRASSRLHRVD